MNIRSALDFIKHNVAVFLIGAMMFAGAVGWLWNENKVVHQYKSEVNDALSKRETELQKRELAVGQAEAKYAEREKALEAREIEYQRSSEQLELDQQALSAEYGEKAAERQLLALMSEFSAMGVDLNANPYCGSKEDLKWFRRAKAKYSEIDAFAQAHSLEEKYSGFLVRNMQSSVYGSDCSTVFHIKSPAN